MKYVIIHGGVIEGGKVLKVGDSIELEPREAEKMGGKECFLEASKYDAQKRAEAAANAELAKAGIAPELAKAGIKAEKGGK